MWHVMKRGAARRAAWRTVYRGSEEKARRCYRRELAALERGHLLLIDAGGRPVCSRWIPARVPGPHLLT